MGPNWTVEDTICLLFHILFHSVVSHWVVKCLLNFCGWPRAIISIYPGSILESMMIVIFEQKPIITQRAGYLTTHMHTLTPHQPRPSPTSFDRLSPPMFMSMQCIVPSFHYSCYVQGTKEHFTYKHTFIRSSSFFPLDSTFRPQPMTCSTSTPRNSVTLYV